VLEEKFYEVMERLDERKKERKKAYLLL